VANWAWAIVVTQRVLELHEGPARMALIALVSLALAVAAGWAGRRLSNGRLRHLPWLLVAGIVARQAYLADLRKQYRASAPVRSVGPAESLAHPLTTTDVAVRYYTLASDRLTSPRLRLVLLTDLHITSALAHDYYDHVFDLVAAQDADLILLAGDYASRPENLALLANFFGRSWPARLGVFAVLGNHDIWTDAPRIREILRSNGVRLVEARCQHLPDTVGRVAICGTDAPWGPELPARLDRNELNLVLSHTPDNVYRLAAQGASIVFSGHTHGGQIRVPYFGSVVVPSRSGKLFDEGHFRVNGTELFVSAGVGVDTPALRIYCPPEILVIDLAGT
jgi:predicted MPP superfamily phosphohydrolase